MKLLHHKDMDPLHTRWYLKWEEIVFKYLQKSIVKKRKIQIYIARTEVVMMVKMMSVSSSRELSLTSLKAYPVLISSDSHTLNSTAWRCFKAYHIFDEIANEFAELQRPHEIPFLRMLDKSLSITIREKVVEKNLRGMNLK